MKTNRKPPAWSWTRRRKWAFHLAIFFLGTLLFWLLRPLAVQGGDRREYQNPSLYSVDRPMYQVREPGAAAIWQLVTWTIVHVNEIPDQAQEELAAANVLGFDIVGAFCGGLFLSFFFGFLLQMPGASAARYLGAGAVVLISSVVWSFPGHIEFYAPFFAALMFFYWRAACYFNVRDRRNFLWMAVGAFLALTAHRAALFHFPALAVVWLSRDAGAWRLRKPDAFELKTVLGVFALTLLLHVAPYLVYLTRLASVYIASDENILIELLTPWTQGWADYVERTGSAGLPPQYLFARPKHWLYFFFFLGLSAPLGAPAAFFHARRIRLGLTGFLAAAAVCGWIWAFFWHPWQGLWDWDLFSHPALPTNLLACALILGWRPPQ